jgi:hypothetical protein
VPLVVTWIRCAADPPASAPSIRPCLRLWPEARWVSAMKQCAFSAYCRCRPSRAAPAPDPGFDRPSR